MRRTARALTSLALVAGVSGVAAAPAAAEHPCRQGEICWPHWCPTPYPPFVMPC
jgi:hypothetical protein